MVLEIDIAACRSSGARVTCSSRGKVIQGRRGRKCAVVVLAAVNTARKIVVLRTGVIFPTFVRARRR